MIERGDLSRYTDRYLLEQVLEAVDRIEANQTAQGIYIEGRFNTMSDETQSLQQSVEGLKTAVAGVQERVSAALTPLQEALATAQETIRVEREADATEDADYEAKVQARDDAIANLQSVAEQASTDINQASTDLNKIAPADNA